MLKSLVVVALIVVVGLAELLADLLHGRFVEAGVDQVEGVLAALDVDGPDLALVIDAGRFVDQQRNRTRCRRKPWTHFMVSPGRARPTQDRKYQPSRQDEPDGPDP